MPGCRLLPMSNVLCRLRYRLRSSLMNPSPKTESPADSRPSRLVPWLCLLAAVCWSVLLRVPLILNAPVHLDSDLAVDGLTLQEAVAGHWRWHYPGTPYMGIGAVLLSWPQARIWGASPKTLVSGGTVAHVLLIAAVFTLAWRVFGRSVAIGSLVPLTFASTGVLWLSGRITGGHLLIVAWSAGPGCCCTRRGCAAAGAPRSSSGSGAGWASISIRCLS